MDSRKEEPRQRSPWEFGAASRALGCFRDCLIGEKREQTAGIISSSGPEITMSFFLFTSLCYSPVPFGYKGASINLQGLSGEGSHLPKQVPLVGPLPTDSSPNTSHEPDSTLSNQTSSPSYPQYPERELPLTPHPGQPKGCWGSE